MTVDGLNGHNGHIDNEDAKELAQSPDPATRAQLARRDDLSPELLYYLASDSNAEVRANVAQNRSAPGQTHMLLANDDAQEVRSELAKKIASSYAGENASASIKENEAKALAQLADDQLTVVRSVLAEAIKSVPGAPSEIVLKLAGDSALEVCAPVLEHSPVLSDDALIKLVNAPPTAQARRFISKRQGVSSELSEAIVETDDIEAIGDLLDNNSAQLQESLLDDLVERAENIELWHAPLVARRELPKSAPLRLARFVATDLLEELQSRTDIDSATLDEVKKAVEERLTQASFENVKKANAQGASVDYLDNPAPLDKVSDMLCTNRLNDKTVIQAIDAGDFSLVLAVLIICSEVEENIVKSIFRTKSAKGIVAICQLAKAPIGSIVKIQQIMGRVPPGEIIKPRGGDYPLTKQETSWQIEFYRNL